MNWARWAGQLAPQQASAIGHIDRSHEMEESRLEQAGRSVVKSMTPSARFACRSLQLDSKHGVIESTRQSYSRELADDAGPVLTSASAKDPCVGDALLGEYSLFALRTFTANLSNPALKEFSDAP